MLEIITQKTFNDKVFKEFKNLYKESYLSESVSDKLNNLSEDELVRAFLQRHIENYKYENKTFFNFCMDLCFSRINRNSFKTEYGIKKLFDNEIFDDFNFDKKCAIYESIVLKAPNSKIYELLTNATIRVVESFKFNESIGFDDQFYLDENIRDLLRSSGYSFHNQYLLKYVEVFQNYLLETISFKIKKGILDEEEIDETENSLSTFWFGKDEEVSSLYVKYLKFLDDKKETSFKNDIYKIKKKHFDRFISLIVSGIYKLNNLSEEEKKYFFESNFKDKDFEKRENSIIFEELKVYEVDINFIFTRFNNSSLIEKVSKEIKLFKYVEIEEFLENKGRLNWELNLETEDEKRAVINEIVSNFFIDKFKNLKNYSGYINNVTQILISEFRELELYIKMELRNKSDISIKKSKI